MMTVKLPQKHAYDWAQRCLSGTEGRRNVEDVIVAVTARTVTLSLNKAEYDDLKSDATYYAHEMGPDATGDFDYRPAARRCLAALPEWSEEES